MPFCATSFRKNSTSHKAATRTSSRGHRYDIYKLYPHVRASHPVSSLPCHMSKCLCILQTRRNGSPHALQSTCKQDEASSCPTTASRHRKRPCIVSSCLLRKGKCSNATTITTTTNHNNKARHQAPATGVAAAVDGGGRAKAG